MTAPSGRPLVGVSVVSYRSARATADFVRSAIEHRGGATLRICCLDNSDDADEFARLTEALDGLACADVEIITVRAEGNLGYGRGHNRAAAVLLPLGVSVVLVANPDVVICSGSLDHLAEQVLAAPRAVLGATTLEQGEEYSGTSVLDPWTSRSRRLGGTGRSTRESAGVHFVNGHFLALGADLWRSLGGFADPYFLYFEEADLAVRARREGGTVETARGLLVAHAQGLTTNPDRSTGTRKSRTTVYHSTRSAVVFARLHFRWRLPVVVAARLLYGCSRHAGGPQALPTVLAAIRGGLGPSALAGVPR